MERKGEGETQEALTKKPPLPQCRSQHLIYTSVDSGASSLFGNSICLNKGLFPLMPHSANVPMFYYRNINVFDCVGATDPTRCEKV